MTDTVLESAPYPIHCSDCQTVFDSSLTEALVGNDHRWDLEAQCPTCESLWWACGIDPTPSMRDALLKTNGSTVLQVENGSITTASAMKALRHARSLSLTEARSLADQLLGLGIEGTLVEMEVIARLLLAAGATLSTRTNP
ncbi:hypothetical protein ACFVUS_31360 [Nocardia sp. NPDC058058]|uniref:hypothetical protein n=1 Tax=Nocardia sp. NPDC058058 TaxID=3346317 RepID=UPI0036DDD8CA